MGESTPFEEGPVRGWLHRPQGELRDGLVITHGAGGNAEMPLLAAVATTFAENGLCVLRCDLPFRQKRRRGAPYPADAAADQAGLKDAVAALRRIVPGRVFLGGQSYGGRQATLLAAREREVAGALLLLSYPLHPPGKPDRLRTAHFPSLQVPALFVHGTRDPFASSEELSAALALIPSRTALVEIEGAGHDLARGRFDLATRVLTPFRTLAGG